jgi:DNA-binding NtrC family response regulator
MKTNATILIVDDEPYVRDSLSLALRRKGFQTRIAAGVTQALEAGTFEGVDVVVTDLKMPEGGGIELLKRIREKEVEMPVIVMTAHGDVSSAVECMKVGANDFLEKPADLNELMLAIQRALREMTMRRELEYLRTTVGVAPQSRQPLGRSPGWQRVIELVEAAAPTDSSVLLLGESGTGKEEVARLIHRRSLRHKGAFVSVNCGAIPLDLFESEFFGHRKGAFTGALADRDGRFKVAHQGTLFLDEIGCLPEAAQAKILRVLQDGVFERVGEAKSTSVDVRVISATNVDLAEEVQEGRFRRDLFYRIHVVPIYLPPLRERLEDIPILAEAFLQEFATRMGKVFRGFDLEVLQVFRKYPWPGNIRELRNVIERAVILGKGDRVSLENLPGSIREEAGTNSVHSYNLRENLAAREKKLLSEALSAAGGVRRTAATLLGIDERNLSYYLKKHGIVDK